MGTTFPQLFTDTLPSAGVVEMLRLRIGSLRVQLSQVQSNLSSLDDVVAEMELQLAGLPLSAETLPLSQRTRLERLASAETVAALPDENPMKRQAIHAPEHEQVAPQASSGGQSGAKARGESLLAEWARNGTLIRSAELAKCWDVTPQALQQAVARGELLSLKVAGKRLYPREFLHLSREAIADVCRVQQQLSASEQLIFWLRQHGGLGGKTVSQALEQNQRMRVIELAKAWADERMPLDADS